MAIDAGSLTIYAEIAIALAGFASLVSVIGARAGGDPPMLDANRLRNLVDTSLLVVVFALLPAVPFAMGLDATLIWRGSSAAYLLCLAGWAPVALRRQARLRAADIRIRAGWAGLLWLFYLLGVLALALGAAGVRPAWSAGFYVLGLTLNVMGGCGIFLLVIASILIPLFAERERAG